MNALRKKDKAIYNSSNNFFQEEGGELESALGDKKRKPKLYKDLVRDQVLNKIKGHGDEGSGDEEENTYRKENIPKEEKLAKLAYDEEQVALRTAFLGVDDDEGSDNDASESWLKAKKKSTSILDQEIDREREEELNDLTKLSDGSKLLDPHGEIEDGDNFLLDFIKNKRWVDQDLQGEEVDSDDHSDGSLKDLERMDNFESKYNFRFEEAMNEPTSNSGAGLSVVGYARTALSDTIRRKDDSRKLKRKERKERKAAERRAKEEQLKRLKNAKREELEERIGQIKGALGENNHLGTGNDLDEEVVMKLMQGDFDPDKFESMMSKMYDEDFYEKEDTEWKTDADVKESLKKAAKENPNDAILDGIEDGEGDLYDAQYGGVDSQDEYEEKEGEKIEEVEFMMQHELNEEKDTPLEKKLKGRMMDELYKLDYEDIIGDLKTRFKYRPVKANAYGLKTEEILFARDTTLKQFVSLKKMAPYDEEGEYVPGTKKRKRFREMNKMDLKDIELEEQKAIGNVNDKTSEEGGIPKKKRRRQKKGKKKDKAAPDNVATSVTPMEVNVCLGDESRKSDDVKLENKKSSNESKKPRKKKGKKGSKREEKKKTHSSKPGGVSDARLASYGI